MTPTGSSFINNLKLAVRRAWPYVVGFLWVAALVGLPMTSFTPFVEATRAMVAPFSALPVFLLILIWVIPYLLKGGKLARESTPFFAFVLVAIAASAAAFFIEFPDFKDKTILDQELRAFITLAIGAGFFLVFAAYPHEDERLRRALQWISIGGALLMVIGLLQAYYLLTQEGYAPWFAQLEDWLTVKAPNFRFRGKRVTGLTYEASWFGHQMVMLYFSLWLSAAFQRISAFRFRLFKLSFEDLMLAPAFFLFFMSDSRIALASLLAMIAFLFARLVAAAFRRLTRSLSPTRRLVTGIGVSAGAVLILAILVTGAVYVSSKLDWRMVAMVKDPPTWTEVRGLLTLEESTVLNFGQRMSFLERTVYWLNGWKVFNRYPWLGVGLGNAGYFALEDTPGAGWGSFEIRHALYRLETLPNTKSFWVRLLAETGLAGFSVFVAWLAILWRSAALAQHSKLNSVRLVALGSRLAILAFIFEGFSIDSFAMPYLWVWLGLSSVAGLIFRQETRGAPAGAQVEVDDSHNP